jgi:hypothetical protein
MKNTKKQLYRVGVTYIGWEIKHSFVNIKECSDFLDGRVLVLTQDDIDFYIPFCNIAFFSIKKQDEAE